MTIPEVDLRTPSRRTRDEQIAAEPPLAPPELPPDAASSPLETHLLRSTHHPLAVAGVVENGLVRPLDPGVRLPEHSRVIIVASGSTQATSRNSAGESFGSSTPRCCWWLRP